MVGGVAPGLLVVFHNSSELVSFFRIGISWILSLFSLKPLFSWWFDFGASQDLAGLAFRPSLVSLHQTFFWWAILPMFGFLVSIVATWTSFSGFTMACMPFGQLR
ncbi:hypothetical protein E1A91_D05G221100v1 [Gossypium mustelinum]|uniref:Uncharacterized protein n=1 Tax=Gossypium mustelinum TaxID=34275 RepID=A0A5D2UZF4_GOSMU|nr:hypothetical protein E1A91_D05G221100v1 [Gossypium mustelinum]